MTTPKPQPPAGFDELVRLYRYIHQVEVALKNLSEGHPEAAPLTARVMEYERQAEAYAGSLSRESAEFTGPELQLRARSAVAQPTRAMPASAHCAVCPIKGCGRELPIDPALADLPYDCSCPRKAELHVGRDADHWVLLPPVSEAEKKETINRIAHALFTGQGYRETRHQPTLTAADHNSGRMTEAFRTFHALAAQSAHALLAGDAAQALELARRAHAAERAYQTHERRYRLARREYQKTGRWHDTETFWIEQPDPYATGHPLRRYTFRLLALWREDGAELEVVNGHEVALDSGVEVEPEAWSQLVRLLTRVETKPGSKVDPLELIYRSDRGHLVLRGHIKQHYPKAVAALDALRRSLRLELRDSPAAPLSHPTE